MTPWALLCTCGFAKEGKGGESRLITEVVHPSESIVIILVISPHLCAVAFQSAQRRGSGGRTRAPHRAFFDSSRDEESAGREIGIGKIEQRIVR